MGTCLSVSFAFFYHIYAVKRWDLHKIAFFSEKTEIFWQLPIFSVMIGNSEK
jgi:hypothetical protein